MALPIGLRFFPLGPEGNVKSVEVLVDGADNNRDLVEKARAGFVEDGYLATDGNVLGDLALRNAEGLFSSKDMEFFGRVGEIVTMATAA